MLVYEMISGLAVGVFWVVAVAELFSVLPQSCNDHLYPIYKAVHMQRFLRYSLRYPFLLLSLLLSCSCCSVQHYGLRSLALQTCEGSPNLTCSLWAFSFQRMRSDHYKAGNYCYPLLVLLSRVQQLVSSQFRAEV